MRHDQAARQYAEYLQEAVEDEEGLTPEEYEERMNNVKQLSLIHILQL